MDILTEGRAGLTTRPAICLTIFLAGVLVASFALRCTSSSSPNNAGSLSPPPGPGSTAPPPCGQKDDGLIHTPPNYNSFTPPAKGGSYADPQYGCTVTRLSDAKADFNLAVHHQYSTINPMNQNDTFVILGTESGQGFIVNTAGNIVVAPGNFPATNSSNFPWDPASPNFFYFTNGNQLLKGTISGSSVAKTVLHTFVGYLSVVAPDQEDLSDDGCKYWLVGTPLTVVTPVAILYNLCTDTVVSESFVVGVKDTPTGWHKIQIFPSGKMLMTWNSNGPGRGQGLEVYNTDGSLYWHIKDGTAHSDVGTDLQGREVLLQPAGEATSLNACGNPWLGVSVIDINARAPVNCLLNRLPAYHVSYRDSSKGWVLVSTFDSGTCPDYSCFVLPLNWHSIWPLYGEELLLVKIDGSTVYRLAHHRSRSAEYYWAESRAAISRDGRYGIFDSNMNNSISGLIDFADVYLVKAP